MSFYFQVSFLTFFFQKRNIAKISKWCEIKGQCTQKIRNLCSTQILREISFGHFLAPKNLYNFSVLRFTNHQYSETTKSVKMANGARVISRKILVAGKFFIFHTVRLHGISAILKVERQRNNDSGTFVILNWQNCKDLKQGQNLVDAVPKKSSIVNETKNIQNTM